MDPGGAGHVPSCLRPGRGPRGSVNILQALLRNLRHLDLTGRIERIEPVMKAHGGYCDVFTGFTELEGHGEVKVAVKRLRGHIQGDRDFAKALARELRVWSSLLHPNILPFLGYSLEGNDYPALISQWMVNGTALSYIKRNPYCDVLSMILGIAEGLEYLHEMNIIHSDMKADNVLISPSGLPLICDFGLSHIVNASQGYAGGSSQNALAGSARWMSAELLEIREEPPQHTKESDVWAFGMTVYELLTKQFPYFTIRNDVQVLWAVVQGVLPITPFDLEPWPTYRQSAWYLCLNCWRKEPSERISIADAAEIMYDICNEAKRDRLKKSRLLSTMEELEKLAVDLTLPNPHDSGMPRVRNKQSEDYLRLSSSLSLHLDGLSEGSECEGGYFPLQGEHGEHKEPDLLSMEMVDDFGFIAHFPLAHTGSPHSRHNFETRIANSYLESARDDSDDSSTTLAESTTSDMTLASDSDTDDAPPSPTRSAKPYSMKYDSAVGTPPSSKSRMNWSAKARGARNGAPEGSTQSAIDVQ